jgi:hypothetical protein
MHSAQITFLWPKSDLSSTTKCDQNHICDNYEFGRTKAGTKRELLFNKPASAEQAVSKDLQVATAA